MPFGNITHRRHGCRLDLPSQSLVFAESRSPGEQIDKPHQLSRLLPAVQVFEAFYRHVSRIQELAKVYLGVELCEPQMDRRSARQTRRATPSGALLGRVGSRVLRPRIVIPLRVLSSQPGTADQSNCRTHFFSCVNCRTLFFPPLNSRTIEPPNGHKVYRVH